MNNKTFKKSQIATTLSVLLSATALPMSVSAAESAEAAVEVITVTGMRSSIQESTRLKRDASGVVDAISAEDMGKFPDTNLAESLQRITGVSISRTNGEGSEVTVRGFGAGNNMVTLNGRQMPAATTFAGSSGSDGTSRGGSTRAFDFANLASESVKSVEVYKTGKANVTSGGIGATINIATTKPLDNQGLIAKVGAKAVMDTTNRTGSDITPELSGILSYSDDDATFGVSLSASHQERDSGSAGATVNNWNIGTWGDINNPSGLYNNSNNIYENAPADGQLYARPNDLRYAFSDTQRTRDNAQLTLQFRPIDNLLATVDYTYAQNEIDQRRSEITNWMQNGGNVTKVVFDDSAVATPIYVKENYAGGSDEGFEQQYRVQTNTLKSLGANLELEVNDRFTLSLDAHSSEMESAGTGPRDTGELAVGLGNPSKVQAEWFWEGELATYDTVYDDTIRGANGDGMQTTADVGSSMARLRNSTQKSDVDQIQFTGSYEFDDGHFDFGVDAVTMESRTFNTNVGNVALGNWGIASPGEFEESGLLSPFDIAAEFDDVNTSSTPGYGVEGNADDLYDIAYNTIYNGLDANGNPLPVDSGKPYLDNNVKEETLAFFTQVGLEGELGGMPFQILAGLRYEKTDVTSTSIVNPIRFAWEDNNDINPVEDPATSPTPTSAKNSYDSILPTLDLGVDITDELKGRFSFGKTIARAGIDRLGVSASDFGGGGGSTLLGSTPTANASNPGLLPLESTNFDVSLEWYFDDTSYASVGYFHKDVAKFIGTTNVNSTQFGIKDVTGGPRAIAAAQALLDNGFALDDTYLYSMMVLLEHPEEFPNGAADFTGDPAQVNLLAETPGWDLFANASDPEVVFNTSTPTNNRDAAIYGTELAVQHFFSDTGFGVQANYTLVRGNVGFDNLADPTASQFALIGLSDTANLVAMYEKDGLQARIAYNWRDEYLAETNKGSSNNPRYVEAFSQIDVNVSYEVSDELSVFFEGINITGENSREHARNTRQLWYYNELGARYNIGARYNF